MDIKPFPQYEEIGIPLLRRVVDAITEDPSGWYQRDWITSGDDLRPEVRDYILANRVVPWDCGTACCVAGHGVLAKGAKLTDFTIFEVVEGFDLTTSYVVTADGETRDIQLYAADLFGISDEQAYRLFYGENGLALIRAMVTALEADPRADLSAVQSDYYAAQVSS